MEYVLAAAIAIALIAFVSAPLRAPRSRAAPEPGRDEDPLVAELEARKEAKYREIRDTELDREQGKLSQRDFQRQDAELRREAIQILEQLDHVRGEAG